MLHRLELRVLPSLTLAVIGAEVRKRKRVVMLVPGLVAFGLYRVVKQVDPLSDVWLLLGISGLFSAVTALWAYRIGREARLSVLWRQDGLKRMVRLIGWVGFAYGVQLSLLVLALLRVLVHYDFLRHPDGPAMMALIIACTSVARDAFEIGHVRKLQQSGQPVMTYPDGASLRALMRAQPQKLASVVLPAVIVGMVSALGYASLAGGGELGQLIVVSAASGSLALVAYLIGEQREGGWRQKLESIGWSRLFQFWWWPGVAFGATYYLVISGIVTFLLRMETVGIGVQGLMAGLVSGIIALYGYYLGDRRQQENRMQQTIPQSLLRCPFVMGMLSKARVLQTERALSSTDILVGESGRRS